MRFLVFPSRSYGDPGLLVEEDGSRRGFFSDFASAWVIVEPTHLAPHIEIDGTALPLHFLLYDGAPAWKNSGAVFHSISDGWIYNPGGLREPLAYKDVDGTTWLGDGWWKLSGEPTKSAPSPTATPRGTILNQQSPTVPVVRWTWPRWERTVSGQGADFAGDYAALDRTGAPDLIRVAAPAARTRAWHAEVALWR